MSTNTAIPPDLDLHSDQDPFERSHTKHAIVLSLLLHGLVLFAIIFKGAFLPSETKEYLPSLRVDLVALPGHKVNETPVLTPVTEEKKEKPPAEPKPSEVKIPVEKTDKADITLSTAKKKKEKEKSKEKIKNALARIKALEKIAAMQKAASDAEPIKGNIISKGSSISGEAKNSLETTYYDVVLEKIRSNWELPKWLQDQNLSAKVLVLIDRNGQIASYQLLKSSGNDQFDQEVKRALQVSAPFPAPPTAVVPDLGTQGIQLGFPL